ncbi:hypothetical protein HUJ05_001648 [Dendroctonus ponderosae]|nr:hypothetical protein HUJ05_001648 [Dendroctonus ponderosae]
MYQSVAIKMGSKAIDIYYYSPSPPSRAVLMLMKALGLEHNIKITNVVIGESKKPEFIKMNPLHTIPLITDNDWHLYDRYLLHKHMSMTIAVHKCMESIS